jgi:putative NADH-flavin reductase
MKITVFGATGRIGRHILAEAKQRDHRITAFTRRPESLTETPETVVHGDGRDKEAVARAVDGADAVIAVIGPDSRKGPHQTAEVARTIIGAMTAAGVRRLVVTSAYPIVAERPRLAIAVLRRVFAASYADGADMERLVAESGLDWTVARLNRLLDRPAQGSVQLSTGLLARPRSMTRADAATALLDLAEANTYAGTAVNICGVRP